MSCSFLCFLRLLFISSPVFLLLFYLSIWLRGRNWSLPDSPTPLIHWASVLLCVCVCVCAGVFFLFDVFFNWKSWLVGFLSVKWAKSFKKKKEKKVQICKMFDWNNFKSHRLVWGFFCVILTQIIYFYATQWCGRSQITRSEVWFPPQLLSEWRFPCVSWLLTTGGLEGMGGLWLLPQSKDMHIRLIGSSKLSWVWKVVCLAVWPWDELTTCPGSGPAVFSPRQLE